MQQLQPLVANAKLDRPLDSHPSLSRELMLTRLETDDWGDTDEGTQDEHHWQGYHQQSEQEHEHQEQDHELQYQDSNDKGQGYEEEAVEQGHTEERVSHVESEDDHQDE
jgi:hypothetical protein